ncbi:MAG: flagellin [Candidatus Gastranaerophilaceae bacterium]
MSLSINTNVISLTVQRHFNSTTDKMNDAMEKMTTGFKINSAADDAAGYGVVKKMESILSTYEVASTNGQMGSSLLQTQEGVLEIISSYLQRIRDLTEQAANGTYATSSRIAIASEVAQRMSEMNRLCDITDFNGLKLLDGSQTDGVNLQVGINSGDENVIVLDKSLFASAKITSLMKLNATDNGAQSTSTAAAADDTHKYEGEAGKFYESAMLAQLAKDGLVVDGTIQEDKMTITALCNSVFKNDNSARMFLDTVDLAVNDVTQRATEIGSYMNRVDSAVESIQVQQDNLTEAKSLIKDTDVAKISSQYLSYQILQQAGATMLTTANQTPQIALNLI